MMRHVAMFRWNDDVDDSHVRAVGGGLDRLPAAIEQIRVYRHGPDLGLGEGNFDYVVVADFDSVHDFEIYRDHPVHQELIRDLIAGRVATRAAVQYEFE